jgi:ABC-type amino acid transport substrate-binding protein
MFAARNWAAACAVAFVGSQVAMPASAEEATLRIATQVAGTVNWEITTITSHGFDKAQGLKLEVQDVAAGPAAQLALLAGEADVIVSDWLWVARERAEGQDLVFIPYSRAVGALHVPAGSTATKLSDLAGKQIGVLADLARLCPAGRRLRSGRPDRTGLCSTALGL